MNKRVVLDASAILALLNQEAGHKVVEQYLANSVLSTVNLAEVVTVLRNIGMPPQEAETIVSTLVKEIIAFDQQQAYTAAGLIKSTKPYDLSLGDRACLALAQLEKLPVVTADKIWCKLNYPYEIICIR